MVVVRAIELAENVEVALVTQAVPGCDVIECHLEVMRCTEDPGHDREVGSIEIWSALSPLLDGVVDTVGHVCSVLM
jgi:hypothetical protein